MKFLAALTIIVAILASCTETPPPPIAPQFSQNELFINEGESLQLSCGEHITGTTGFTWQINSSVQANADSPVFDIPTDLAPGEYTIKVTHSGSGEAAELTLYVCTVFQNNELFGTTHRDAIIGPGSILSLVGDLTVPENTTLRIFPGVKIVPADEDRYASFSGDEVALFINGTLKAEGTAADPIIFELSEEEAGGRWGGIHFQETSIDSRLSHTVLRNTTYSITNRGKNTKIEHVQLESPGGTAIRLHNFPCDISYTTIYSAPIGIFVDDSAALNLTDSTIANCGSMGLWLEQNPESGDSLIDHCIFNQNGQTVTGGQYGISVRYNDFGGVAGDTVISVSNSIFSNNTLGGIYQEMENGSILVDYTMAWSNGSNDYNGTAIEITNPVISGNPFIISTADRSYLGPTSPYYYSADDGTQLGPRY